MLKKVILQNNLVALSPVRDFLIFRLPLQNKSSFSSRESGKMTFIQRIEGFERENLDALMQLIRRQWEGLGFENRKTKIIVVSETIKESDFPGGVVMGIPVVVIRPESSSGS